MDPEIPASNEVVLTQEQALNILVNAVVVAQKRGAYELKEAAVIASAVERFVKRD